MGSNCCASLFHGLRCMKDIIRRHADAYFEYVYPITTHGFLHQGTFLEKLDEEEVPIVLLKEIAVCASQFVASGPEAARQAAQWAHDVDAYIMNNLGSFSILNLEILILWANHHHSNGNLGKTWMLLGLAARLAYCLQINVDSTTGSPSEIECRRRMMWSIRILDRLLAGTVEEFSLCSRYLDSLKLPCDEHLYLAVMNTCTWPRCHWRRTRWKDSVEVDRSQILGDSQVWSGCWAYGVRYSCKWLKV
jgi:hypothetical protein